MEIDDRSLPGEREAWDRLHVAIDRLTPETAGAAGYYVEGWTAKDAVAHLGTWMAEGAQVLRQIAGGTFQPGELDVDAANARFLDAMRDVPLETVHLQADAAHAELLRAYAELPRVTEDAAYWIRKAGPEHVAEHLPRLEAWIDEMAGRR